MTRGWERLEKNFILVRVRAMPFPVPVSSRPNLLVLNPRLVVREKQPSSSLNGRLWVGLYANHMANVWRLIHKGSLTPWAGSEGAGRRRCVTPTHIIVSVYSSAHQSPVCSTFDLLKDDVFQSVTHAYLEKEIPRAPNRSRTYDLPISTSDALPLSYRRLVVARPLN